MQKDKKDFTKTLSLVFILLTLPVVLSLFVAIALADVTRDILPTGQQEYVIIFTATANANGIFKAETMSEDINGYVHLGETISGSPAPTLNYDITMEDSGGRDIFGGTLLNRDSTRPEEAIPKMGGVVYGSRKVIGPLTLRIKGNTKAWASVVVKIHFYR